MRLPTLIAAAVLLAACGDQPAPVAGAPAQPASPAAGQGATHAVWHTELAKAAAESTATGKPILADFQGSDWCPACKQLHKKVFATEAFSAWAARRVVLLDVDLPNDAAQPPAVRAVNEELVRTHGVSEFPTVLLLDAKGAKLAQVPIDFDRLEPAAWIAAADPLIPAK